MPGQRRAPGHAGVAGIVLQGSSQNHVSGNVVCRAAAAIEQRVGLWDDERAAQPVANRQARVSVRWCAAWGISDCEGSKTPDIITEKIFGAALACQQGFGLAPQRIVAGSGIGEESRARASGSLERRLHNRFKSPPAGGCV